MELLIFQTKPFHLAGSGDDHGVFRRGVHHWLGRRGPRRWAERGCLLQSETSHARRPGDDRVGTDQFEPQERCAGDLEYLHPAPKAALDFEVPAGESARSGLADSSAERELSSAARPPAAGDNVSGDFELTA